MMGFVRKAISVCVAFGIALATGAWLPHGTASIPVVGFFVNPATGSDSNNGTSGTPCGTNCGPWATLTPVAGVSANANVSFACSSLFQPANFSVPQAGMTFGPYNPVGGTTCTTPPTFDASTALGPWTQGTGEADSGGTFDSGFEVAALADWTTVVQTSGTVAQSATQVYLGSNSMKYVKTGAGGIAYVTKSQTAFAANTSYAFRFFLYLPSGQMTASGIIDLLYFTGMVDYAIHLSADSSGNLSAVTLDGQTGAGGGIAIASTTDIAGLTNQWVEIDIVINTSATVGGGSIAVNNGTVHSNFTFDNSGFVGRTSYQLGSPASSPGLISNGTFYIDNFASATQTTIIGPVPGFPTTVWRAAQATNPLFPIFPANTRALPATSAHNATAPGNWYWDGSTFLYVYSLTNPGTTVGVPTTVSAITVNGKQNVTFGAITVKGAGVNTNTSLGALGLLGNFSGLKLTTGFIAENNYQNGVGAFENTALIQNVNFTSATFRNNGASGFHFNVSFMLNNYFGFNRAYQNCSVLTNATSDITFCGGIHWFSENANTNGNSAANAGQGTIVENNWSYNNGVPGQTSAAIGIGYFVDTVNGYTVRNNNAYGNQCDGIHVEKNGSPVVYGNNMWGNSNVAFCANLNVITSGGQNASNGQFFNNTIDGQGVGYYCISANPYQGLGSSLFNSNTFTNNISIGCTQNVQQVTDPGADNSGGKGSGNTYTFNNYGAPATNFLQWGATACGTYACFATAGGAAAANNISGDPMFTNPTASPPDFSLQMGSPAIGASVAIPGYISAGTNLGSNFAASN